MEKETQKLKQSEGQETYRLLPGWWEWRVLGKPASEGLTRWQEYSEAWEQLQGRQPACF